MAYLFTRDRAEPGFYHVWKRAIPGRVLFRDDEDRLVFEDKLNRYLTRLPSRDGRGRPYPNLSDKVRLCARNILATHYHLGIDQLEPGGIADLMHRVTTAYVLYYNRKYGTNGSPFKGEYNADKAESLKQIKYRILYVNANHKREGVDYRFSTHRRLIAPDEAPSWLDVERTLGFFGGLDEYLYDVRRYAARLDLDRELRG